MPIGVFAQITGLSHRALRLYADRGLLPPAHIQSDTGYRYYDVHAIRAAEMIRLLRTLGVPLNEMQQFIDAASDDSLTETLEVQKSRLKAELAQLRAAFRLLGRVDQLNQMFREAPAVDVITLPAQPCLQWSGTMRRADFHDTYIDIAEDLARAAVRRGLRTDGREIVLLLDKTDKGLAGGSETVLRYQVLLPVAASANVPPDLLVLDGGRFARSAFPGPYDDGYRFAYARQLEWLADSGLALRGPLRMRFASDRRDTDDPSRYATELIWPVTDPRPAEREEAERADLAHRWLAPQ